MPLGDFLYSLSKEIIVMLLPSFHYCAHVVIRLKSVA
jgi:hypothetical protein